jgi:RHS repeat-associated protein
MEKSGQSFYYHADGLSSITELTNQSGTVVQRYTYSSFGKVESQLDANFLQPYTYTSRESDTESQLYYYRMRTYDALIGRFLQEDPIGVSGSVNVYNYLGGNPVGEIDPLGLDAVNNLANLSAGLGDTISLGLTSWVRKKLEINDVIDECSWSYSFGKWAGWLHGIATSGAGLLNGGARTVLWSGGEAARNAARSAGGKLLEDTLGGKALNLVNDNLVTVPMSVWKAASAVFAANAKGEVKVIIREVRPGSVYNTIERPILDFINRLHTAINGSPATKIILR